MAGGALDPHGIWLYGEDDERDQFSDLLNIGQDSVSDAIAIDRARIDQLVGQATLTDVVTAGIIVASAGWSVAVQQGRKRNGIAWVSAQLTRTGAAIVVDSAGEIGDTELATFTATWQPAAGMGYFAGPRYRLGAGFASATQLVLTHLGPGETLATGAGITVMTEYPLG